MTEDCGCTWRSWCWYKAKGASLGSLTIAWSYVMLMFSAVLELIFQVPDIANEFGFASWVPPRWLPWYTGAMAVITLLARLRSIIWKDDHVEQYVRRYTDDAGTEGGRP